MKYKILQIGKYFSLKGGIETVTQSLVASLQKDHIIDVLCFSEDRNSYQKKVGASVIWEAGKIFNLLSSPISFKFFQYFKALRNNYNTILIHAPNPLATLALLLFHTKAKVIILWHGDILNKGIFYFFFKAFEKKMLKRADMILATSSNYLEHSSVLKGFKYKCRILPLGINEKNLVSNPALVKRIRIKYKSKKIVFSLGRYVYYKGFEYLIEAAQYISDEVIILIGGYGPQKFFYETCIESLHLQHKVFLIPELNHSTWGSYFEACDVFCLPSYKKAESFGLVVLEAMSFCKPVIATNIPGSGTPWVNKHNISGLNVNIKNSKELAEAIQEIIFSKNYAEYCKNSRKRFDENFTEEKMVTKFLALLKEVS